MKTTAATINMPEAGHKDKLRRQARERMRRWRSLQKEMVRGKPNYYRKTAPGLALA